MFIKQYRQYLFIIILVCLTLLGLLGLSVMSLSVTKAQDFDRRDMLTDIAEVIVSCHQSFAEKTALLNKATHSLVQSLSEDALLQVQQTWRDAGYAWSQCEFYEIGGLEVMILHNQINKSPNLFQIQEALESQDVLNSEFIESKGSTMKGLGALETFLFSPEDNQAVLNHFADTRYKEYVTALGENLQQKALELVSYWAPEGNNYAATFAAADQADGSIKGSINMLMNEMINSLEKVAREKIAKPFDNISSNMRKPELAEAYLSQTSLDRIKGNVLSGQQMFTGGAGLGIDDYLRYLGTDSLVGQIVDQFDAILEAINQVEEPFELALVNHPERVNQIYNAVQSLLILVSVDAANQLGITVTFNDSDGD